MRQRENDQEKIPGNKSLLGWIKEILSRRDPELETLPAVPRPEVVTSLITKASGLPAETTQRDNPSNKTATTTGGKEESTAEDFNKNDSGKEDSDGEESGKNRGCSYAMKRNIVASLQEIRRFAEEHDLAATMVKALLSLLAEIAVGALKGKVSGTILEALLKVFKYDSQHETFMNERERFESEKDDAYRRGEIDGRNARIIEEHFPAITPDVPHLRGGNSTTPVTSNIFTMAKEAGGK